MNNGHTNGTPAPVDPGGGFLALDPSDPKDQATIRREMTRHPGRWRGMDQAKRDYVVDCLEWAMKTGRAYTPPQGEHTLDGAKLVVSAAKTMVMIEGQNQTDERPAGSGGPTVNVNGTGPVAIKLEFDRGG